MSDSILVPRALIEEAMTAINILLIRTLIDQVGRTGPDLRSEKIRNDLRAILAQHPNTEAKP